MENCYVCDKPGAEIADPCCGAPDCDGLYRRVHLNCLPPKRRAEELAFLSLSYSVVSEY